MPDDGRAEKRFCVCEVEWRLKDNRHSWVMNSKCKGECDKEKNSPTQILNIDGNNFNLVGVENKKSLDSSRYMFPDPQRCEEGTFIPSLPRVRVEECVCA